MTMRWADRVYGTVAIDDPSILDLIATPTFQRLQGIKQAGPSALAFPFKTVTRYEHSLGVYLLLVRLGADRREQVAGLLHDISHTAFSHAVDFLYDSAEQDHHEDLKPRFLERPDITPAIQALGYRPADFFDDSIYPILERPLPGLCADRVDYFLRDSLACGVLDPATAQALLGHLVVADRTIAFDDVDAARLAVERFSEMNHDWWASPTEAFLYNEFADALREGIRLGALSPDDLLEDDDHVLGRLESAHSGLIDEKLDRIRHFREDWLVGFRPRVVPKTRRIDPLVIVDGGPLPLSRLS